MAKLMYLITNFTAGEIDELLDGRVDLTKYRNGLDVSLNGVPFQQGGWKGRAGSRFVARARFHDKRCCLIPFSFGLNQHYVLEFGDQYIRFYANDGQLIALSGSNLITNGTFDANIASWDDVSAGSNVDIIWESGTLKLRKTTTGGLATPAASQLITVVPGNEYEVMFDNLSNIVDASVRDPDDGSLLGEIKDAPVATDQTFRFVATKTTCRVRFARTVSSIYHTNIDNVQVRQSTVTTPLEIGTPYTESQVFQIKFAQSADVLYLAHPKHPVKQLNRLSAGVFTLTDFLANPPPTFEADTNFNTSLTLGATSGLGVSATAGTDTWLASDVNRQIVSGWGVAVITVVTSATAATVDILTAFSGTTLAAGTWFMQGSPATGNTPSKKAPINAIITLTLAVAGWRAADVGKYVRLWDGICEITEFTSSTAVKAKILVELTSTAQALEGTWTLEVPSWSAARGHPRAVGFHDGRLLFAGSDSFPDTVWGSKVGKYTNFARGVKDADPFQSTLGDGSVTFVEWLATQRDLMLGTSASEVSLKAGADEPITPSKVRSKTGTSWGSESIMPVKADRKTVFVQAGGNILRALAYSFDFDGYVADDLMLLAANVGHPGITQISFEKIPLPLIWAVRSDGALLSQTFDPSQEVFAWSRHLTLGDFESVCSIVAPDGKRGQGWVVVKRPFGGFAATGATLIVNGTFDTDINNWLDDSTNPGVVGEIGWEGVYQSGAAGQKLYLYVYPNQSGRAAAYQSITTVAGKRYSLRFDTSAGLPEFGEYEPIAVKIGTSKGASDLALMEDVEIGLDHSIIFTATSTSTFIYFEINAPGEIDSLIDNVEVFENVALEEDRYIEFFDQASRLIDRHPLLVDSGLSYDGTNKLTSVTPGATSGDAVTFTAGAATFVAGDVGKEIRQISGGNGRATITAFTNSTTVTAKITQPFSNTEVIPAGSWGLAVKTVLGLDHLAGQDVHVLGDLAVYPPAKVAANGSVVLDGPFALKIDIGLPFVPEMQTLRPAQDLGNGNMVFMTKGYSKIYILFNNTVGAEINGQQENWRSSSDLMDEAVPPKTDIIKKTDFGYDGDARITIRQTQPLPIMVIAIQGVLEVGDE